MRARLRRVAAARIMEFVLLNRTVATLSLFCICLAPAAAARAGQQDAVAADQAADEQSPTEESLGFPIYPSARFLRSYDAGRGQRYYLFGTNSTFVDMVNYYRLLLEERGDRVFDAPATHIFEVGRFREESMAFPPGVTIKDYTWNGAEGYLHAGAEAGPERFSTIIQIVPPPPGQAER
ncbi:MAG: hypothetical protein J4F30_08440 [Acidobacteria bacterium]|nr:hypothetical protein [Acidobacteriota bacterium]